MRRRGFAATRGADGRRIPCKTHVARGMHCTMRRPHDGGLLVFLVWLDDRLLTEHNADNRRSRRYRRWGKNDRLVTLYSITNQGDHRRRAPDQDQPPRREPPQKGSRGNLRQPTRAHAMAKGQKKIFHDECMVTPRKSPRYPHHPPHPTSPPCPPLKRGLLAVAVGLPTAPQTRSESKTG